MDLAIYILGLRGKVLFKTLFEKWPVALMNSFFILFFGVYGLMFGHILDKNGSGLLETSIYSAIVSLTLIKAFLPTYKRMIRIIPSFYPVSRFKSIVIDIMKDFVSPFFLFFLIFIVAMTLNSIFFDYKRALFSMLLICAAHLTTRIIKTIIENKLRLGFPKILSLVSSFTMVVLIIIKIPHLLQADYYYVFLIFSAILIMDLLLETSVNEHKRLNVRSSKIRLGIYGQLLLGNKKVRTAWMMAIGMKIFIIVLDIRSFSLHHRHIMPFEAMLWLFLSPSFLFTYVFNNTFGCYRNFWLTLNLRTNRFIKIFSPYLRVLLIPILTDYCLFLIYSIIIEANIWVNTLIYLCFASILICLAPLWSILFPIYLGDKEFGLRMSSNTSRIAAYVTIAIIFSIALVKISVWFYLLLPGYMVIGIYIVYYLRKAYKNKVPAIYKTLYEKN
jgi:hypothetical protein